MPPSSPAPTHGQPSWPEPSPETCDQCLPRRSSGWPGLIAQAVRLAKSGDLVTRARWLQAWPAAAADLFDRLASDRRQRPPLLWPADETPQQQVERVLGAVFAAFDRHLQAQVLPDTPHGATLAWRADALLAEVEQLALDPHHPAWPDMRHNPAFAHVQLLLDDTVQGALRGALRLRLVPAPGAFLAFVPAPANALTFCAASFVDALGTVTHLLRSLLGPARAELQHLALQWNLHTPEQPLLALEGPSAGAAFTVAALSLLQAHLPDQQADLRNALAALPAWLLASAGISIAIDERGMLHEVGAAPDKAQAYQYRRAGSPRPVDPQHLFLHPHNARELNPGDLPDVQAHPVASLLELLQTLARVAQPRPAFQAVLGLMPLSGEPKQDDDQPPPPAAERQRQGLLLDAAWRQCDEVRDLRDYCITRWAYWARVDGGELHMRFVPLALQPAPGADGQAPRFSTEARPGLAALLQDVHDAALGEDRVKALLLEGQAGAGKSTLLQRHEQALALACLRRQLAGAGQVDDTAAIELPLYLPLASLPADEKDPVAWVRTWARRLYPAFDDLHHLLQGRPTARWQRVRLRLLLDGLNELPEPPHMGRAQRAEQVVNRLCDELKLRLAPLLSARGHHGFNQLSRVQQGACVQVQPWQADLVLRYVRRCFSERDASGQVVVRPEGEKLVKELEKPEHRSVLDLCCTPFNAAGQVRLWAGGSRRLVRHRADLYRRLLHQALLRELAVNPETGEKHNPLFHEPALITLEERKHLQTPARWQTDDVVWPRHGGALLDGLFRQALDQWQATDRPPEERGTVEVPWNHPQDPQRSVAHWLSEPLRGQWRDAVKDLGLLADDPTGRGQGFRFRHQSWGEYLASVALLPPTPQQMPQDQRDQLLARLQAGRGFERSAAAERAHQQQEADAQWWQGAPGQAWWQALLDEPMALSLGDLKAELRNNGWAESSLAEPGAVPRANWGDWQHLRQDDTLQLGPAADDCSVNLRGWGDKLALAARHGNPDHPWEAQAACVRALVLQDVWGPLRSEIRQRVVRQVGEDRARELWRSTGALALPSEGSLDEVLGLALLALPRPHPWLQWLLQNGLWPALQPLLPDLQRQLEGGATAFTASPPDPVLQHLRRVLLLRQLDAGPAAREGVLRSGQWGLLASRDADCDPALHQHWLDEQAAAFGQPAGGQPGRDLRQRLQAAYLLGLLGDNLRYEPAAAATGMGLRIKPALWAGVSLPGQAVRHRIGSEADDPQALPYEQRAFDTEPMPYFQVARLLVTCAEWRAFVQAGGYNPQATHWRQAGGAAQRWLSKHLADAGLADTDLAWQGYRPPALDDAHWGWALNPVTTVTVFEAVAYAHWAAPMHASPAGAPAPPGLAEWDTAVPSELWWEAAMRAGPDGRPAPPRAAPAQGALDFNHAATGWLKSSPVGLFSLAYGPAGQADGRGNVWQWCGNALPQGPQPYHLPGARQAAQAGWDGDDDASPRGLRGGAFNGTSARCRPSCRVHVRPDGRVNNVGVRLVRLWPPHSGPRTP